MRIACMAVLSSTNTPLYIETYGVPQEAALRLQTDVHAALDVVEERVAAGFKASPSSPPDLYLGNVSMGQGYYVYGYVSNTLTRFLLATDDPNAKEEDIKSIFQTMNAAYIDEISNPFCTFGAQLTGKFSKTIAELARE